MVQIYAYICTSKIRLTKRLGTFTFSNSYCVNLSIMFLIQPNFSFIKKNESCLSHISCKCRTIMTASIQGI